MGDQVCGARQNNKECPSATEEYVEADHSGDVQNPQHAYGGYGESQKQFR